LIHNLTPALLRGSTTMAAHHFHPWHSISFGKNAPKIVTALIEISRGSKNKYEIDKDSGLLMLDRVMSSPVFYPTNYGFIPQTYCEDGDALDIMVLGQDPVVPMALMNAKVIGAMKMIDGGDSDDKILAVHADDPHFKHFSDISEIQTAHPKLLDEISQFFKIYKLLDKKSVEVLDWVNAEQAEKIVLDSIDLYNTHKNTLR